MSDLCRLIWSAVVGLFRSRAALQAEILFLRHQLNVLRRRKIHRGHIMKKMRRSLTDLVRITEMLGTPLAEAMQQNANSGKIRQEFCSGQLILSTLRRIRNANAPIV
jgi:hypothetical protein